MKKIALGLMVVAVPLLSGCSMPKIPGVSSGPSVSFVRSSDGGVTFESKTAVDEKTNFSSAEVISIAMNPQDTRNIFVGTRESGMFVTDNSGDSWRKIIYPPTRIYGLVIDSSNPQHLFATGEWEGRGKIYQSGDAGANWNEVYTEPAIGTVITTLAQDPFNPQVVYAGTSAGMVIRTNDGGATWKNIVFTPTMSGKIIRKIVFETHQSNAIYFLVDGKGVFVSDGEKIVTDPTAASGAIASAVTGTTPVGTGSAVSLALDPGRSGVVYAGLAKGLLRSNDFGKTWEALNVIESSKKFPVGGIAVNPKNSDEIAYVSALTLYKSTDRGVSWSTHQIVSDKSANFLQYDPYDPNIMYVGFKK
ncbi:MAG: YCF48-related protein [Candidatus Moranbacteria bacterium]|nr:YCF48-related protein [Candidatus Moranbacteria bacterium]